VSDSGVASEVRGIVGTILAGAGGLLLRDAWKWVKRRREERKRREELFAVLVDAAQWQLDEARGRERLTATGRIRPVTPEEIAERRGRDIQRRDEIARRLWEAQGHEERRGTGQRQEQDVFREGDTE